MATCIMGFETRIIPLHIAFLGYNRELGRTGMKKFAEDNQVLIEKFNQGYFDNEIKLKDGTIITLIHNHIDYFRGNKFDQLILFDDDRWMIFSENFQTIRYVREYLMKMSNVPEEFQLLLYEDVRKEISFKNGSKLTVIPTSDSIRSKGSFIGMSEYETNRNMKQIEI